MESRDRVKALAGEPTCQMEFLIPNLSDLLILLILGPPTSSQNMIERFIINFEYATLA